MSRPPTYCTIEGCDGRNVGRGLCRKHYSRWHKWGDPLYVAQAPVPVRLFACKIEGCTKPQKAHSWCLVHYRRFQRHGDPLHLERVRNAGTPEQRWWARVDFTGTCWIWKGAEDGHGYGQFAAGRMVHAYRWGYETFVGPVPEGRELDHLCRNRACVRFDHLEPVTHLENVRRGLEARSPR